MALSRKKKIIIAVSAVVLLALIIIISVVASRKDEAEVTTVKLDVRPELRSTVTASGEVRPIRYIKLTSEIAGRILEIYVNPGDQVTKNQPLVRIDPTQLQSSQEAQLASTQAFISDVQSARNGVASAQQGLAVTEASIASSRQQVIAQQTAVDRATVDLNAAQRELKRSTELIEKGVASRFDYDAARDRYEQTKIALETAKSNLESQKLAVKEAQERANQQRVAIKEAQNNVKTSEARVNQQQAKVKVDALGDKEVNAVVTMKNPLAVAKSDTTGGLQNRVNVQEAKEFKVTLELKDLADDVRAKLRPGMSSTATITTKTKTNVIAVPLQAIVEKAPAAPSPGPSIASSAPTPVGEKPKEQKGVYILDKNNKVKFVEVTTGITGESDIEITSGLQAGVEVITGPSRVLKTLKDGAGVKRQTKAAGANVNAGGGS